MVNISIFFEVNRDGLSVVAFDSHAAAVHGGNFAGKSSLDAQLLAIAGEDNLFSLGKTFLLLLVDLDASTCSIFEVVLLGTIFCCQNQHIAMRISAKNNCRITCPESTTGL